MEAGPWSPEEVLGASRVPTSEAPPAPPRPAVRPGRPSPESSAGPLTPGARRATGAWEGP